jgi:phosphoadenosine phosphosulfate reductase
VSADELADRVVQGLRALEDHHPSEILQAAVSAVPALAVATSFQVSGMVILHMIRPISPEVPVLFLDTGFHFPETLAFKDKVARKWSLNVVELRGRHGSRAAQDRLQGPELYRRDPELCCRINKVEPLQHALDGFDAWVTGIRRDQSPARARARVAEIQTLDSGRRVVKVNPLAHWTRADVDAYVAEHRIPVHPLLSDGFPSIGCAPCTSRVAAGQPERAGRWDGITKTECGIHTFGSPNGESPG